MKKFISCCLIIFFTYSLQAQTITAAEYFIDTDPGVGNGTAIPVTPGVNANFVASVSTTSLANGFHFVAIRTRQDDGKWGLFEKAGLYISTATTNAGNITAAEYFIDTDPGVGNGTAIPVTPGVNVNFVANVSTTSLANGFHFVAIRTRDADGKWGLFEKAGFYISTQTTNSPGMTDAEFFIDTDPGIGNGTAFTIPGGQSFNQDFILPIPTGISNGQHFIGIRVKNDWGLFAFETITVTGGLPLDFLSFIAYKENNTVQLDWKTENEVNTSHFEVERSSNGTVFNKIATVVSANSPGVHAYSAADKQPVNGVNFYRLKQVDIDGRFRYSLIVTVLFTSYGEQLNIYPNPAAHYVQFNFSGRHNAIIANVFNAQGRQVLIKTMSNLQPLKLDISNLAAGKYTIQLSDGETLQSGSFIKL